MNKWFICLNLLEISLNFLNNKMWIFLYPYKVLNKNSYQFNSKFQFFNLHNSKFLSFENFYKSRKNSFPLSFKIQKFQCLSKKLLKINFMLKLQKSLIWIFSKLNPLINVAIIISSYQHFSKDIHTSIFSNEIKRKFNSWDNFLQKLYPLVINNW